MSEALETFTQAVTSLHAAGRLVDGLSGAVVLADLWLAAGRRSEARRLSTQALTVAATRGAPVARAAAELHVALSELTGPQIARELFLLHNTVRTHTKHSLE